jgi:hypothetical protein
VDVVEAQHDGAGARQALQQVPQRPVHAMAIRVQRLAPGARQRGQRGGECGRVGQAEAREGAVARAGEMAVQRVRPQRVREVRLELRGAAVEHRAAPSAGARPEVLEQPRLADAGLALDDDDARSRRQRVECALDRLALTGAADQRGRRAVRHATDSRAWARARDRCMYR